MNAPATVTTTWPRRAFVFAVLAFAWWRFSDNTVDNDLWGHVLYGQRMIHLGGLERTDALSWTARGLPWINHEVLAEIALGAAHQLAGGAGLWLMMIALAAVTLAWTWREGAGREPARQPAALTLLALCTNFIALGYAVRPQLFTYLFFVVLLTATRRFLRGGNAWGLVLPPMLALWANTHGGYLAGWAVLMLALGIEFVARRSARLVALAAASTLALCANPYGWRLVAWTMETLRLPRTTITEWQPMGLTFAAMPFYFVILIGAVAWARTRLPRRPWEPVVWALLAVMSIQHRRHAPLFGLATLMFLPAHMQDLFARLSASTASLRAAVARPAVAAILALALTFAGGWCVAQSVSASRGNPFRIEVPRGEFPVAAIAFIRQQRLTGNTITFFDWGQEVLWELPDNPVSFDGRLDTVYPEEVMDAHWLLYAGQEPGPALDLDRAKVALLPTSYGGIGVLRRHGWSVAYIDPLATVLTKAPVNGPVHLGDIRGLRGSVPFPDAPPPLASRP